MIQDLRNLLHDLGRRLLPAPLSLSDPEWAALRASVPFIELLSPDEAHALRERIGQFLARKTFKGIGLELQPWQRHLISAYACLPILHLGINAYRDWQTLLVYPDTFAPEQEWVDEAGVHHQAVVPQAGEAWERGPVILSWADIAASRDEPGLNVVIHEMAHKLDMLTGEVDGLPPLHRDMAVVNWSRVFTTAYNDFCRKVDRSRPTALDPYAADCPGEFFALLAAYSSIVMPISAATRRSTTISICD
jgi:Mlc titration factor MtfA (ptsG expression regulator)